MQWLNGGLIMFSVEKRDKNLFIHLDVLGLIVPIFLNPLPEGSALAQFSAGYPNLTQQHVIFRIFAMGFNIVSGLTVYIPFGHAAFL